MKHASSTAHFSEQTVIERHCFVEKHFLIFRTLSLFCSPQEQQHPRTDMHKKATKSSVTDENVQHQTASKLSTVKREPLANIAPRAIVFLSLFSFFYFLLPFKHSPLLSRLSSFSFYSSLLSYCIASLYFHITLIVETKKILSTR